MAVSQEIVESEFQSFSQPLTVNNVIVKASELQIHPLNIAQDYFLSKWLNFILQGGLQPQVNMLLIMDVDPDGSIEV